MSKRSWAVNTTLKSAVNVTHPVWLGLVEQLVGGGVTPLHVHTLFVPVPVHEPPAVIAMLVTSAMLTSLAVHWTFLPKASCRQGAADAGWAPKSSPPTVKTPSRRGSDTVQKCQNFM